jgi:uncharacterized protein (TIGR00725 family)
VQKAKLDGFLKNARMQKFIVGVMGQGEGASEADEALAESLGELVAKEGWALLTGGRDVGVMHAASRGAKKVTGSVTIGILPSQKSRASPYVDIAIVTDLHEARNNINVLSSNVIVACGRAGPGTTSEIALAVKAGKTVVLLGGTEIAKRFFQDLSSENIIAAQSTEEAIQIIKSRSHI